MIGYSIIDEFSYTGDFSLSFRGASDSISTLASRTERNLYLFLGGVAINIMAYAFDWDHGDFIIEKERNAVLYKFGIRANPKQVIGLWVDPNSKTIGPMLRIFL